MKQWLYATILAFVLSFGGIAETQVKSQFPKLNEQDAIGVTFDNCDDVIFSITVYGKDNDIQYYAYEVGNTIFAIIEFGPASSQSIAIYVLQQDKTILKFVPSEYSKTQGPCQAIRVLKLHNDKNKF